MEALPPPWQYSSENPTPHREKGWGLTKNIPIPNIYVKMLPEYRGWIYLEDEAVNLKGNWKSAFANSQLPLDLEIGCGNGFFFEQQIKSVTHRNLLGIELKYKPLVQTVRRAKRLSLGNGRGLRFHARYINYVFAPEEIHNVYIYFPDPWPKNKEKKNRLLKGDFLNTLYDLQKPGHFVDFKSDSRDYFEFVEKEIQSTPYKVVRHSYDLHKSEWAKENFMTSFEKIFLKQGQQINYMRLSR